MRTYGSMAVSPNCIPKSDCFYNLPLKSSDCDTSGPHTGSSCGDIAVVPHNSIPGSPPSRKPHSFHISPGGPCDVFNSPVHLFDEKGMSPCMGKSHLGGLTHHAAFPATGRLWGGIS